MPSRILKESICTSESLAYLSAEAEVLFYRLIVKADDFGLYYGSPKILASLLFPLNVPTEKKVSSWLAELVNGGLVAIQSRRRSAIPETSVLGQTPEQARNKTQIPTTARI